MTIYCGVDFHARVQTVSYCDSTQGEIHTIDLNHQTDDLRSFYSQFKGDVIVGLEASGYSPWFEQMLEGLGHQVWIGDAAEIRRMAKRRQKNDRRDAELILDLLVKGEFPRLHKLSASSQEVLSDSLPQSPGEDPYNGKEQPPGSCPQGWFVSKDEAAYSYRQGQAQGFSYE
jgi:hypothetical protein